MSEKDSILKKIKQINHFKEKIYVYINTTRYQFELINKNDTWNQICSSLDVIGDTLLSLEEYLSTEYPETEGLRYIYTYGILQSLFIQQDSIRNLSEAFSIQYTQSEILKKIREIRNFSIGHPTKLQRNGKIFYNYISRISLCKNSFTLQIASKESQEDRFIDINVIELILKQLEETQKTIKNIAHILKERDLMHRKKYKGELIVDIFPSTMSYNFEKIGEAIYSPSESNTIFGLTMLNSVKKNYEKFEEELRKRNELPSNTYLKYDLDQYFHTIEVLNKYLHRKKEDMTERDAIVYLFYLREVHNVFLKIAAEYDEEYNKTV